MPVFGVVRSAEGDPVQGARVYFTSGPGPLPDIAALTDATGAFALTAPTEGAYRIGCTAEGFAPAEAVVEVAAGRRARVEIWLRP